MQGHERTLLKQAYQILATEESTEGGSTEPTDKEVILLTQNSGYLTVQLDIVSPFVPC